jgi:ABC-type anion transport system duplicated permease subunit
MRIAVRVLAILLVAGGAVWILQGIGVLPGSLMTGQIQWAYRGAAAAAVGLAILLLSFRRKRNEPR